MRAAGRTTYAPAALRRLTWIVPVTVALALLVGFLRAEWRRSERTLPQLARTPPPIFAPLYAPIGAAVLRGRVVDVDGEPVPEVALYLRSGDVPHWVTSDAEGRFAFERLLAGEIEVVVLAWGHPPRTHRLATGTGELELVLPPQVPPAPRLPDLAYAPASGRVAHPFSGAWVDPEGYEVIFEPRAPVTQLGGAVERRARTDARGFFAIDDLALGEYTVRVLPAWARGGTWPDLVVPELADYDHTGESFGGDLFALQVGGIETDVRDPSGEPIEGALALLFDAENPSRAWLPQASDAFGHLRFLDLPPGSYALLVRAGEAQPPELVVDVEAEEITRPELPPLVVRKRAAR